VKQFAALLLATLGSAVGLAAHAATDWSTQDYDLYPGDFDGDGHTDILYVAKDPSKASGIARSDASNGPNGAWQSWAGNFLGIPWYGNLYSVIVADFNGDLKADILLQRNTPGDHYLLLADAQGKITGIDQTIPNSSAGVVWSGDQHKVVAGDFNRDGKADVFLQATSRSGLNAIIFADSTGRFTSGSPGESWNNGFLGLSWSTAEAIVYAGDFDGANGSDLLVQAKPAFATIAYEIPFPVPTYAPNKNAVVLTQAGSPFFTSAGLQAWSRNANGVDWSSLASNLVIGDFNGDRRSDVLIQAKLSSHTSYWVTGNASGAIFSAGAALASNISWSGYQLTAGNFDGSSGSGIYFQAFTPTGNNAFANVITGGTVAATNHDPSAATGVLPATAVGKTAGSFAVTHTGLASYSVPLTVPPGIAGIAPALELTYQSQQANGLVGVGWGLGGFSEIVRCGKTRAQDGSNDSVKLTAADTFCLDGNKLRLTSGTYGAAGSTYQTELETFARITAVGAAGNGPASFLVQTKDGRTLEYGGTADARIEPIGGITPHTWALDKVSDRSGNTLTISYCEGVTDCNDTSSGAFRPNEINYTSNASAGITTGAYKVAFVWEQRPTAEIPTAYVAGGLAREFHRLNRIETQYNDPASGGFRLVRRYQLSYNNSGATGRSRLASIQECDRNAACLSPTLISWQDGLQGWVASDTTSGSDSAATMTGAVAMDFDGDGLEDLIYPQSGTWWYMRATGGGEFGGPTNTGISSSDGYAVPIDYDSNGAQDLLVNVPSSSTRQILSWNGSALGLINTNITATLSGKEWAADFDGDGRIDFGYTFAASGAVRADFLVQSNQGDGQFAAAQSFLNVSISGASFSPFVGNAGVAFSRVIDLNGDGRADFVYQTTSVSCPSGTTTCIHTTDWKTLLSTGTSFVADRAWTCVKLNSDCEYTPITGDFNGDGLTDVITFSYANNAVQWYVGYGSGLGLTAPQAMTLPPEFSSVAAFAADYDGDGRADLLYPTPTTAAEWKVLRSTGVGFESAAPINISTPTNIGSVRAADFDGDGQKDIGYKNAQYRVRRHAGAIPDMARSVTDGFGNGVSVTYAPMTDSSVYTKCTSAISCTPATFPNLDLRTPAQVVKQYSMTDGLGGNYTTTETYVGARLNLQGRGYLGFMSRTEVDSRTGIQSGWNLSQAFPRIGSIDSLSVKQPNGKVISSTVNQFTDLVTSSVSFQDRHFPYVSTSTELTNEVSATDPTVDGQGVTQVTTTTTVDNFGNQKTITATSTDLTGSGESFVMQVDNRFDDFSASTWCGNFLNRRQVTKTVPNQSAVTRTVDYVRDSAQPCRVYQEIVEPLLSDQTVTTTYGYDSFGNLTTQSVSATGISTRLTTVSYGSQGVFPTSFTNAANETATKTFDYALGANLSVTDPNNVTVFYQYDGFGRKVRENRPDNTATSWTLYGCNTGNSFCGDSLLRFQILEQELDSLNGVVRYAIERSDAWSRPKYREEQSFSGALSVVKTDYDNRGLITRQSKPYFSGATAFYTSYTYDLIGRPLLQRQPVDESDATASFPYCGACRAAQFGYSRLTYTLTDPNSRVSTKRMNAWGQVKQITDTANATTTYQYDPFGNLKQTTDPTGNTVSASFNVRGMKLSGSDPDMGNWIYTYYPTGEVKTQTDAKGQITSFTYDNVSRLLTRVEAEGTTTFVYGASQAARNVGQRESASSPGGYVEHYSYDSLGRPQEITTTVDSTNYVITAAYNSTSGMLDSVTYPTSTSAAPNSRFKVKYEYAHGVVQRVRDFNNAATVYWERIAADASGRTIDEQLGNGLHTYSTYDPVNGFLENRFTGSSSQIQNLSYQWDKVGNLTERQDASLGIKESFFYDNLYRLDYSTLKVGSAAAATNLDLSYDAQGNVTSKSDVGSFNYSSAQSGCSYYSYNQPHAVRNAGGNVYCYDANGNVVKRQGSNITWTSYNLPSLINQGSNSAQFFYGADRARYKQVAITAAGGNLPAGTETTVYISGLFEKIAKPGSLTEYKNYIIADSDVVAVRTLRSNGVDDTRYLHKDHLGSVDVVTNETGAAVLRLSYDAFGKRRNPSTWGSTPSSSDWTSIAATTHRGFTSHEQLDNVGLTHMNGRVFDPTAGRFLSADPFVQSPLLLQGLNRYSYVMNNPLSFTDPSGFFLKGLFHRATNFFKSITHNLNYVAAFVLTVAGIVAIAYGFEPLGTALIKVASALVISPVQLTRTNGGYGVVVGYRGFGAQFDPSIGNPGAAAPNWGTGGSGTIAGVPVLSEAPNPASYDDRQKRSILAQISEAVRGLENRWWSNEGDAASQLHRALNGISREFNIEIGVQFFRRAGGTEHDAVYVGTVVTDFNVTSVRVLSGSNPPPGYPGSIEASGFLHTHAANGANYFSGQRQGETGDLYRAINDGSGGNAWLSAPDGHLYKWNFFEWQRSGARSNDVGRFYGREDRPPPGGHDP
jgi:RHS repeat-associated protein